MLKQLTLACAAGLAMLTILGCSAEPKTAGTDEPTQAPPVTAGEQLPVKSPAAPHVAPPVEDPIEKRDVDIAICLDTSGSMSGLIESAKQKLWAIVNELATAKPQPNLRVALYHYGNSGLNREMGWVQQLCPLTGDLDEVYAQLFKLKTNGGTEYVARVSRAALIDLDWSKQKNALKMIVVAGNEKATQDTEYTIADIGKQAASSGVIINTIYCGSEAAGRNTGWADVARFADGQYAAIDQNSGTVAIATPYDKKLAELSTKLNTTYVGYGRTGAVKAANQTKQDHNAATVAPEVSAQRAMAKSSSVYRSASWDVVDAVKDKKIDLANADDVAKLPQPMQEMKPAERVAHVEELAQRRADIQKEIQALGRQREAHVKKEMEAQGLDESQSFDAKLRSAVREQGTKKGMTFQK